MADQVHTARAIGRPLAGITVIDLVAGPLAGIARGLRELGAEVIRLEIDGGVKVDNIRAAAQAGADTFVAGSAIFGQPDYQQVIQAMRSQLAA